MFPPYHVSPPLVPSSSQEETPLPSQRPGGSPFSLSQSIRLAAQKLDSLGGMLKRAQAEDAEGLLVLLASKREMAWVQKEMPWPTWFVHGEDPSLLGFVTPKPGSFRDTLVERAKTSGDPRLLSVLQATMILPPDALPMQSIPVLASLFPYLQQSGGAFVGGVFLPSAVVTMLDQDAPLFAAIQRFGQGML